MSTARASGTFYQLPNTTSAIILYSTKQCCLYLELHEPWLQDSTVNGPPTRRSCDVNFMYRLYHDCARTLKRSLSGKLAIVELPGDLALLAIP